MGSLKPRKTSTTKGKICPHPYVIYARKIYNPDHRWIDILDDVIYGYNHRIHRSIGVTPNDFVYGVMDNRNEEIFEKSGIEIGDYVRVRIEKSIFQKGSTQKWSNEVYKVIERNGYGFKLEGEEGFTSRESYLRSKVPSQND